MLRDDARGRLAAARPASKPNQIYAAGIGKFLEVLHLRRELGVSFALMAFTTFVYDTLDVCTRLGRYIIQELTGWRARGGRGSRRFSRPAPRCRSSCTQVDATGRPVPVWRVFWNLFGASNQLLAALTLWASPSGSGARDDPCAVWFVTGVPTSFMYVMSTWAPLRAWRKSSSRVMASGGSSVAWVALIFLALAAMMLLDAVAVFLMARAHRCEKNGRRLRVRWSRLRMGSGNECAPTAVNLQVRIER